MKFKVLLTSSAKADIFEIYEWLLKNAPDYSEQWFLQLSHASVSLQSFPNRCALSPESDAFEKEVRQLLIGKKPNLYGYYFLFQAKMYSFSECGRPNKIGSTVEKFSRIEPSK